MINTAIKKKNSSSIFVIYLYFIFPFKLSPAVILFLSCLPAPTSYYCGLLATANSVIIITVVARSLHEGSVVIWTNCDEMSSLLQGWKTLVGTHGAGSGKKNVDQREKWNCLFVKEKWRTWCLLKLKIKDKRCKALIKYTVTDTELKLLKHA